MRCAECARSLDGVDLPPAYHRFPTELASEQTYQDGCRCLACCRAHAVFHTKSTRNGTGFSGSFRGPIGAAHITEAAR